MYIILHKFIFKLYKTLVLYFFLRVSINWIAATRAKKRQ